MSAQVVVGIDLGTTHTVVASAKIGKRASEPAIFEVPQLTAARETEPRPLLPSCLYAPIAGEIAGDPDWVVGELARRRGAEVMGRFVASAKSWLSHAAVDRMAPILPWGVEEGPRISPVDASARVLAQAKDAWDRAHPDAPLAEQDVVITLPASFDEVARELTLEAAKRAGLQPTLLEEPTAAFYDAMRDEGSIEALLGGDEQKLVLVCDVGGGTTDLSLVAIDRADAAPGFVVRRIAVGRHILLGGDNMDLALAHVAESRIAPSSKLEPGELAQLVLSCRDAKERILAGDAEEARVVVLGRGSKLVGGARATTLTKDEVTSVVLGGFFPAHVEATDVPKRGGIVAFGLPYERDPAITRHIRAFLARHASEMPRGAPDALLLNGGVFHAAPIVSSLVDAIAQWGSGAPPVVLPNADPDLAVARGAVLYGFARRGIGMRVESGAAHGYYAGLAGRDQKHAVCILPRGAKEGQRYEATGRTFDLVVGKSVRFELWASDVARDEAGAIVTLDEDAYERLPPIVTRLPASGKEQSVAVVLGGELLPTGQLELACVEAGNESGRRFRLEFQLREGARATSLPPPPSTIAPSSRMPTAPSRIAEAEKVLDRVMGKRPEATPREVKDLVRDLEKVLGDRQTWTMEATRHLADKLLLNPGARRRTAAHERLFWQLLGYCLRPGFGDPGDPSRIEKVWPLFEGRLGFPEEPRGWPQFFIAWRRMAGGLSEPMQLAVRDAMDGVIAPTDAGFKKPKRMPEGPDELLATLAALERVPIPRRVALGEWILEKTWTDDDPRHWSALGRIGARVPLYASAHHVVPTKNAEAWIDRMLRLDWKKVVTAPHAAVQLARVTGDRARDVDERRREEVAKRLTSIAGKPEWIRAVREHVAIGEEERVAIYGEALPIGLRLSSTS